MMESNSTLLASSLDASVHGRVMVLTISGAVKRNTLGPSVYTEGMRALASAKDDPAIGCIVITGGGLTFSAGGDLHRLQINREQPASVQEQSIDRLHDWIRAIQAIPKPVIAAVEGSAAGAGFSLALACDLVVAARSAVFVMAYINIGLSPDGGGSWQLAQALPRQLVNELLMCGERVSALRLHEMGVVNRISEPGEALPDAMKLANSLSSKAGNALASAKALASQAQRNSLPDHMMLERLHFVTNLHHPNAGIGIRAFLDKQPPDFEL